MVGDIVGCFCVVLVCWANCVCVFVWLGLLVSIRGCCLMHCLPWWTVRFALVVVCPDGFV